MKTSRGSDRPVVVIGSGPAGATAALFLARAGVEVTLLEAGSERSARGLTVRLAGLAVADVRRPQRQRTDGTKTADPRAQIRGEVAPGGLANQRSCAVPPFSPDDL